MAELKNCVNTVTNPDGTITEVCAPCQSVAMHDNSKTEGCDPISIKCASIESAVCVPILADQIFDSISTQKEDLGALSNLTFNLDSVNSNYVVGQPVCIKQIGISYDYIGLLQGTTSNSQIVIGGQTFTLAPTSLYDASAVTGTSVNLFNELNGSIALQLPCNCNATPVTKGTKLRLIEKDRAFHVANLKIVATGLIGSTTFTATADTAALFTTGTNLIPLINLAISNMTFTGKLCWPNDKNRMTLNSKFDTKLGIDSINQTSNYTAPLVAGNPGRFTANVDFSFAADQNIYASYKGAIAVFTTPNATILKNGEIIS